MDYREYTYICMPFYSYKDSIEDRRYEEKINIDLAKRLARKIFMYGKIPVIPHTLLEIFDSQDATEKKLIDSYRYSMLNNVDEIAYWGDVDYEMQEIIDYAENSGISCFELETTKNWVMQ